MTLTLRGRRPQDAAVRTVGAALVLVVVGLGLTAVRPATVSACTGVTLDFEDALSLSDGAIYAGRITGADIANYFWVDLTIDIERVIRGPAVQRLSRAQAGHVCDGIQVGQYGYIVRDVLNPEYGPKKQDFFFRVNQSDARAALLAAGLPDTSTAPDSAARTALAMPWTWLAPWLAAAFAILFRGLRRPLRDNATS
ncbi:MAG TPA: hypothetical protein VFR14_00895 [Candidatus Limnocylindrales bacterium]|nr:hypothetical protein [Candidatus Limnocylindrales bacterium]